MFDTVLSSGEASIISSGTVHSFRTDLDYNNQRGKGEKPDWSVVKNRPITLQISLEGIHVITLIFECIPNPDLSPGTATVAINPQGQGILNIKIDYGKDTKEIGCGPGATSIGKDSNGARYFLYFSGNLTMSNNILLHYTVYKVDSGGISV